MSQQKMNMDELILIGIARKVRGNKGDLKIESMSDFPERFEGLLEVFVRKPNTTDAVKMRLEKSEFVKNYAVMKLKGVDSYDDAAAYLGSEILVPESDRVSPPEGTYFVDSLIGMKVVSAAGEKLGTVENVLSNLRQSILLITSVDGKEINIPFVNAFVKKVDETSKEITIELIDGLIEDTVGKREIVR